MPIETPRIGSLGTMHAPGLARDEDARFLIVSTYGVYGEPLVHPQGQNYWGNVNPVGPHSVYDEPRGRLWRTAWPGAPNGSAPTPN
jgi:dTDP-glucose 4,6-dehydratase